MFLWTMCSHLLVCFLPLGLDWRLHECGVSNRTRWALAGTATGNLNKQGCIVWCKLILLKCYQTGKVGENTFSLRILFLKGWRCFVESTPISIQNHAVMSLVSLLKAGPPPPPLEAILVIFGRRALIFFCLKALGKKWKMTPLLCACAVVITLETQKCQKRAPRSVEFNFFINCDTHKRFSQNERGRADLQNVASDFLIFA